MANSFSASFPEIWAKEQQTVFYKRNVAMKIADTSFNSDLTYGDTLNRPYRSDITAQTYTPGTSITIDDLTDTNEQLVVNRKFATGFYVDDFDNIQSRYDIAAMYGRDAGEVLSNKIDADVLGEVINSSSTVDDGAIGGTAGNGIALSTSNVLKTVSAAKKKMRELNVYSNNLYGVISPDFEDILIQYGAARDTVMGDRLNNNGYIMNFYGFDLYSSNQLTGSAVLSLATNPTDGDTVVIEGVTFTFVDTIGTTAGNVHIEVAVDDTAANLSELINAPGTTDAGQVALSTANQRIFENVSSVQTAASDIVTVTYKGAGKLTVSETLTDGTDTWTAAKIKQHNLFGVKGNPVLVMQRAPSVVVRDVETKLGKNILNGCLYGTKTFGDNAKQMVNVEIVTTD